MGGKDFVSDALIGMKEHLDVKTIPAAQASLDDSGPVPPPQETEPEKTELRTEKDPPQTTVKPESVSGGGDAATVNRAGLAGRIAGMLSMLRQEELDAERRTELRRNAASQLERLEKRLEKSSSMRELELMDMEFRQVEGRVIRTAVPVSPEMSGVSGRREREELSKSEIVQMAMLGSLPVVLAVIFGAAAIVAAIFGAMKL